MSEEFNSSGKNSIRVFSHLPVKVRVLTGTLGLLKKLSVSPPVKELGSDRDGPLRVTRNKAGFNHVSFSFHGAKRSHAEG